MTTAEKKKKLNKSPLIPVILSVICAFVLWMYVMSVESPVYTDTFYSVPVDLQNESLLSQNGLSVVSGSGYNVDITVTGKKSVINQLDIKDFTAYVDLNGITTAGEYQLEIKTEVNSQLSVNSLSQNSVTVYVDVTTSKTISIDSNITYYGGVTTGTGYSMGTPYILPSTDIQDASSVIVRGPASVLNTIEQAVVSPIDIGAITNSVTFTSPLVLEDANGNEVSSQYVKMLADKVTVYFPVVTEKTVSIVPSFSDTTDLTGYTYSFTPSSVTVRGEESVLNSMGRIQVNITKNISALVGTTKYELSESIVNLPEGVQISDSVTAVTLTVTKNAAASTNAVTTK